MIIEAMTELICAGLISFDKDQNVRRREKPIDCRAGRSSPADMCLTIASIAASFM